MNKKTKREEFPPINPSFLTLPNINWWLYISTTYIPPLSKRVFFLPCAAALKTRIKTEDRYINNQFVSASDTRKFISQSTSHQYLKAIRSDPSNECIILSEPLTIIPYRKEADPNRPDYNLPVEFLSVQSEFIFIDRLSQYLLKLKWVQPTRKYLYYFGASHHYFILHYANLLAANPCTGETPFKIIYRVPLKGTQGYAKESTQFMEDIVNWESSIMPNLTPLDISNELKKRTGRYTHKPFLLALTHAVHLGNNKIEITKTEIPLTESLCFQKGFGQYYSHLSKIQS
jgi:hypothetical protein